MWGSWTRRRSCDDRHARSRTAGVPWYPANRVFVNRFLRSALFPVVVITLIVWLGTQTLIGKREPEQKRTYSDVLVMVRDEPETIQQVTFKPSKREAEVQLR